MNMRTRKKIKISDIFLHLVFLVLAVISIYPILLIGFNALAPEEHIKEIGYVLWPTEITLNAFRYLMNNYMQLLQSLFASIVYAVGGALFAAIVCAMLGYTLTRKEFIFRKPITVLVIITMFFVPGLIPEYMVNTTIYHLEDSWLIYILPQAVNVFEVIVYRTFFQGIPESLIESAQIDGASHMQTLSKIIMPLSMPILVTQFFLNMVGRWKDYTYSLYYMTDQSKITLEHYVQQIMMNANTLAENNAMIGVDIDTIPLETMRFAVVFFTLIPMLCIFPILQKHFEKGAIVGAVKG